MDVQANSDPFVPCFFLLPTTENLGSPSIFASLISITMYTYIIGFDACSLSLQRCWETTMNQLFPVPIINYFYLFPEEELISTYHPLELSKLI